MKQHKKSETKDVPLQQLGNIKQKTGSGNGLKKTRTSGK